MSLLTNLISYWKLDESSGDATDQIGTNNLTNTNTVTYGAGKINNAATFVSTSSQRLENTSFSLTDNETISISFWHKGTVFTSTPGFLTLAPASTGTRIDIHFRVASGSISPEVRWSSGGDQSVAPTYTVSGNGDGNWHHYVYRIYNSAGVGTIDVYYDGTLAGTTSHASLPFAFPSWTKMYFGVHFNNFNSGFTPYLTGSLDEIGIWDRTITTTEIAQLYNSGAGFAYPFSTSPTSNPSFIQNFM